MLRQRVDAPNSAMHRKAAICCEIVFMHPTRYLARNLYRLLENPPLTT
jgi:hypothetical protein